MRCVRLAGGARKMFPMRRANAAGMSAMLAAALLLARAPPEGRAATCKPPPAKARIKVNLKPDTEVADLITWYSNLTCTPLVVSSAVATAGKKITLLSPTPVTLAELERLFLAALESVGLTVERDGKFLYVIEAAHARHGKTPLVAPR
jgi:type II secretory pathway component GspD/PulD (secretin)